MAKRSYSVNDILSWKFTDQNLPEQWHRHLGDIPDRFTMYVDGDGGHGKTEYILQASKMFALHFGKVRLNNVEQGKHVQIQQSVLRNNFKEDLKPGKFKYDSILDFDQYKAKLKRPNSGRIQFIDSISFWPLSTKQVQELIETFKYKSFVFVAYKAHFNQNKAIQHMCDIKVRVENFKAESSGRFGGNQPYVIWDKKKDINGQLKLQVS